jgi:hypothetical protein
MFILGYFVELVFGSCSECEESDVECRVLESGLVCEGCIEEPLI